VRVVAAEKLMGETLTDQITGMQQSLDNKRARTAHALEQIIRAIYSNKNLSAASPEAVGTSYERSCELVE
jgi:hypothetical protein